MLVTVKISEKIIKNNNYNYNYLIDLLYSYSKYALTMKISKGFDYIIDEKNRIDFDIFQPHFKYEG